MYSFFFPYRPWTFLLSNRYEIGVIGFNRRGLSNKGMHIEVRGRDKILSYIGGGKYSCLYHTTKVQ